MDSEGERLIFGRFTREECGLPPLAAVHSGRRRWLLGVPLLLAALVAAGWLGGVLAARWREAWVAALPARVAAATPGDASVLLSRGRMYTVALPGRPAMAGNLAMAAVIASANAPRRLGYYGNAANLFAAAEDSGNANDPGLLMTAAGLYADLGDYAKAFACLARADAAVEGVPGADLRRSLRLLLVNAQAYFLATAPAGSGRDPGRALELAQLAITSRDTLPGGGYASGSAAFLDTLATARHATGDAGQALAAQTLALGLAEAAELDVYLLHYDEFARNTDGK